MKVAGTQYRTIWLNEQDHRLISIIDQRWLPHKFIIEQISSVNEMSNAIKEMHLRGAPALGAAAAFGMYLATLESTETAHLLQCAYQLKQTRPTAVNLQWGVDKLLAAISKGQSANEKIEIAKQTALTIANEEAEACRRIGIHGVQIIEAISKRKYGEAVNILTHCNAGWLACVDYGTATAPIYEAFDRGIKLHVWVDETRPRNQGASLTAWELINQGVPHTIIADNTGGHLMQHGMVDLVITGADRVTRNGDAANKIGTYLKALAAKDNNIPFYIALPSSTIDWTINDGLKEIEIEERSADEVKYVYGLHENEIKKVLVTPQQSNACNYGFDVTPARLITGFITENGVFNADALAQEGVIKFNCHWTEAPPPDADLVNELNAWRNKLYALKLIGVTKEGIGYGNISIRSKNNQFIITGSGTGKFENLTAESYTLVTDYNFEENSLTCVGPTKASSESLTHAMIYECCKEANAVFHVHDHALWQSLLNTLPSTNKNIPYGTPEMAGEIKRLIRENPHQHVFAMGGHEDGIVAFGSSCLNAFNGLLKSESR